MKGLIAKYNLYDKIYCESAGTSSHHVGEMPDQRMVLHALRRGYELDSAAQQFVYDHFKKFDVIVTMDNTNYRNVLRLDPERQFADKVIPMAHLCNKLSITEVPDPYYGGESGFEHVLDIVEDGCRGLLDRLNILPYES